VRAPGGCGIRRLIQGPSAAAAVLAQSPLGLVQRYSKCSPLTVLLRPQVQIYSLTKLRLILAGAMASVIQQFRRGSNQRVGNQTGGSDTPPWPSAVKRKDADGYAKNTAPLEYQVRCLSKVEAPVRQEGGASTSHHKHPLMRSRCLWLRLE